MNLASLRTVREITPVVLVCIALTSPVLGFDLRFTSGKSALAIPFEFDTNHIWLRVGVQRLSTAPLRPGYWSACPPSQLAKC